jgi:four helix bundle protein
MKDFHQLKVWEKAHQLTLDIYEITGSFPKEEMFGLTSQIRRASMSIPTNIAEGCGRQTDADFARFLQIGMESTSETEYLILLAHDLGYISTEKFDALQDATEEVKRMLASFLKTLRKTR